VCLILLVTLLSEAAEADLVISFIYITFLLG